MIELPIPVSNPAPAPTIVPARVPIPGITLPADIPIPAPEAIAEPIPPIILPALLLSKEVGVLILLNLFNIS
jgi:hypothetical protein